MKLLYKLTALIYLLLAVNIVFAQGWIREFGEINNSYYTGNDVVQASNGDYISCGAGNGNWGQGAYLQRTDAFGDTIWTTNIPFGTAGSEFVSLILLQDGSIMALSSKYPSVVISKFDASGNLIFNNDWNWSSSSTFPSALIQVDTGFLIVGTTSYLQTNNSSNDVFIAKTNSTGDTLWTKTFGGPNSDEGTDIQLTSDGGFIISGSYIDGVFGSYSRKMHVVKTDASGNLEWEKKLSSGTYGWYGNTVLQTLEGGFLVAGNHTDTSLANSKIMFAVKLDTAGNTSWTSDVMSADLDCAALDVIQTADSSFVFTGYVGYFAGGSGLPAYHLPVAKIDKNGTPLWSKLFFEDLYTIPRVKGESIKETADGGLIVCGTNHYDLPVYRETHVLIKMNADGNAITTAIQGNVYADLNNNCNPDSLEFDLENWIVVAADSNGQTYYDNTDSSGNYSIDAEYGTYNVSLAVPNPYWDTLCLSSANVTLNTPHQIDTVDFPVSAMVPCPLLDVDISASFLRLCFPSYYMVHYCNSGMVAAQNAYVQVQLDTFITYNSSLIPAVNLGNNLYQFNIGTVEPGDCGYFYLNVTVDCDTNLAGITHCTEAHIYPDSVCNNAWSGANLNLNVNCLGDSVQFLISNSGGNMLASRTYDIFEDNVMMRTGSYNLGSGQSETIYVTTQNGSSYRIVARQDPNFPPLLGDTLIALAIEACGLDSSGNFSTGFVTQYSTFTGSPFYDIDCQPNIGSYDPNDKLAYPTGYGPEHYIYDYTDLEYYIRFQNTGTDTAFRVVILDTISSFLDLASIMPKASSHPYTYEIMGNGVIRFTFDNIMLPDSNVNEPASHGFVKYSIEQMPGNPVGTVINNTAHIYFDFNAPVATNTTFHEIGENFVTIDLVGVENVLMENVAVKVFPNPFHTEATVQIDGRNFDQIDFELFDITGKLIYQKTSTDNQFHIQTPVLTQGVYIYRILADGQLLNSGKLMAR